MHHKKKGFALLSAVFILVILALLATFIVSLSSSTRQTNTLAIQGVRAYFAARSGIEWGINQVIVNNACFSSQTLNLTQAGLNGFNVDMSCTVIGTFTEGTDTYSVFEITALGRFRSFGHPDFVSRTLQASATLGA